MGQANLKIVVTDTRIYVLVQIVLSASSIGLYSATPGTVGSLSESHENLIYGFPFVMLALLRSFVGMNYPKWVPWTHLLALVVGYIHTDIIGFVATKYAMPDLIVPMLISSYLVIFFGIIIVIRGFFPPLRKIP